MNRLVLALLPLLAGCAERAPSIPAMTCPSLPSVRPSSHADPLPPVSQVSLVLRPGHWDWVDGNYVWESATWIVPAGHGGSPWVDGVWTQNGGGCAWTPGHFLP